MLAADICRKVKSTAAEACPSPAPSAHPSPGPCTPTEQTGGAGPTSPGVPCSPPGGGTRKPRGPRAARDTGLRWVGCGLGSGGRQTPSAHVGGLEPTVRAGVWAAVSRAGGAPALRAFAEAGTPGAEQRWGVHSGCKRAGFCGVRRSPPGGQGTDRASWAPEPPRRTWAPGKGAQQERVWEVPPFAPAEHSAASRGAWDGGGPGTGSHRGPWRWRCCAHSTSGQARAERGCDGQWAAPEVWEAPGRCPAGGWGCRQASGSCCAHLSPGGPPGLPTEAHLQWPLTGTTPLRGAAGRRVPEFTVHTLPAAGTQGRRTAGPCGEVVKGRTI